MIPQPRLDEIRRRCEAATEGPWRLVEDNPTDEAVIINTDAKGCDEFAGGKHIGCEHEVLGTSEWLRAEVVDLELMAHARTDIPDLLAEIDRLKAELGKRE